MFMCKACGEVYDNWVDYCPRASCNGGYDEGIEDFVPVDDAFAPVIQTLQKKGYEIDSCNFGNAVNPLTGSPQIVFDDIIMDYYDEYELAEQLFVDVPAPWRFSIIDGKPTINAYIFGADNMIRYHDFLIAHSAIAEWAENADELVY